MEVHLLDEQPYGGWCATCRAPCLALREWVGVDPSTLLIVERGLAVVCVECDSAVPV